MTISKQPKAKPRIRCAKGSSRTKQQFRDECNINVILKKFQRTGRLEHMAQHQATYGRATGADFAEAMRVVAHGQTLWEDLPTELKDRFGKVEALLDYVSDPDNAAELPHILEGKPRPAEPEAPEAPISDREAAEPVEPASPPTTES